MGRAGGVSLSSSVPSVLLVTCGLCDSLCLSVVGGGGGELRSWREDCCCI